MWKSPKFGPLLTSMINGNTPGSYLLLHMISVGHNAEFTFG
jgi:hypothetical protein